MERDIYCPQWDQSPPPTSPPPPYLATPRHLPPEGAGNPDPRNSICPPPYKVNPPPFHVVSQPNGLERLERWVGTCHREIHWQLRNPANEPPEAPHPQRKWLAPVEAVARPGGGGSARLGYGIYAHHDVNIAARASDTTTNQQHCRTFSGHYCPTNFYIWQDCNLHRQRVCLSGCHRSGETVAVKRVGWEQRPIVECPIVGTFFGDSPNTLGLNQVWQRPFTCQYYRQQRSRPPCRPRRTSHPLC